MKKFLSALMLLISTTAHAAIVTKEISYQDGDAALVGYLAYDDTVKSPAPGVLIVHEWWGHNQQARRRAEMLAKLGYVAFALDMYGKGKTATTPDEAKELSGPFYADRQLMRNRALAGLDVLKSQPQVDTAELGVIGYCFGGTVALELARAGTPVKGVISFHGGLATPLPAEKGVVKAHILALNGADDKFVSPEERNGFIKEMTDAKVNFRSVDYPGATHAFTNPDATATGEKFKMPIAYNKEADEKSWEELQSFFKGAFKNP